MLFNVRFKCTQVRNYVEECARLCQPSQVHICDGSERENETLIRLMQQQGVLEALPKMENWYGTLLDIQNG